MCDAKGSRFGQCGQPCRSLETARVPVAVVYRHPVAVAPAPAPAAATSSAASRMHFDRHRTSRSLPLGVDDLAG